MLNFEQNSKIAKLAKFGEPYFDLGKEIAKNRRQKIFNFTWEQYAVRISYIAAPIFPHPWAKSALSEKLENLGDSLGPPVRDRTTKFCSHRVLCGF